MQSDVPWLSTHQLFSQLERSAFSWAWPSLVLAKRRCARARGAPFARSGACAGWPRWAPARWPTCACASCGHSAVRPRGRGGAGGPARTAGRRPAAAAATTVAQPFRDTPCGAGGLQRALRSACGSRQRCRPRPRRAPVGASRPGRRRADDRAADGGPGPRRPRRGNSGALLLPVRGSAPGRCCTRSETGTWSRSASWSASPDAWAAGPLLTRLRDPELRCRPAVARRGPRPRRVTRARRPARGAAHARRRGAAHPRVPRTRAAQPPDLVRDACRRRSPTHRRRCARRPRALWRSSGMRAACRRSSTCWTTTRGGSARVRPRRCERSAKGLAALRQVRRRTPRPVRARARRRGARPRAGDALAAGATTGRGAPHDRRPPPGRARVQRLRDRLHGRAVREPALLICLGWREISEYVKRKSLRDYDTIATSELSVPVSIVVPAYNEESVIVESVRSLPEEPLRRLRGRRGERRLQATGRSRC